jgi:Zn-dependent protease with chaperone function
LPALAAPAAAREDKAEGYLEYRDGPFLVVDGQRVATDGSTRLKLEDAPDTLAALPLGFEVKVRGVRRTDGTLLARELEAKPNGRALFERNVKELTDRAEAEYRRAGRYYTELSHGRTRTVGNLLEDGPQVDRARRIVYSLLPSYIPPEQVRVYVIENRDWNAFAMGNFSIYVFSGLLDDLDDDEMAIVLGHELAHATHEHTRRQFKKSMWIQLAAIGITGASMDIDDRTSRVVAQLLVAFGAMAWQNGYGRDLEDQADRVGLRYAYEAGYDISKGPHLWQRFAKKYGESGKVANFFFGNHSLATQRAANLERQIALNYPDGPKEGGVRMAVTSKTPAAVHQPASTSPAPSLEGASALRSGGPARKEIRPGMTPDQVRALLGKPAQEVAFGARSTWTYPDMSVVFENGRVTEVKF